MNELKNRLLSAVSQYVEKDPSSVSEFFDALSFGVKSYASNVLDMAIKRDKAILAMMERNVTNIEMLKDVAQVLTDNAFNGRAKVYSLEETAKILRIDKRTREKLLADLPKNKKLI